MKKKTTPKPLAADPMRITVTIPREQKEFLTDTLMFEDAGKNLSECVQWCIDACIRMEKLYGIDACYISFHDIRKPEHDPGFIMPTEEEFEETRKKILERAAPTNNSGACSHGVELIAKERREQIEKHGRTLEKDRKINSEGQLCWAAALLMRTDDECSPIELIANIKLPDWNQEIIKKMDAKPYRERLIIAGALIAAELDRLSQDLPSSTSTSK